MEYKLQELLLLQKGGIREAMSIDMFGIITEDDLKAIIRKLVNLCQTQ